MRPSVPKMFGNLYSINPKRHGLFGQLDTWGGGIHPFGKT